MLDGTSVEPVDIGAVLNITEAEKSLPEVRPLSNLPEVTVRWKSKCSFHALSIVAAKPVTLPQVLHPRCNTFICDESSPRQCLRLMQICFRSS